MNRVTPMKFRLARSLALATVAATLTAVTAAAAAPVAAGGGKFPSMNRGPGPHGKMHPAMTAIRRYSGTFIDQSSQFHCQSANAANQCYGPSQIRTAYGLSSLLADGKDGAGQTIVIVDAYQNPTMRADLATFDSQFGLAA